MSTPANKQTEKEGKPTPRQGQTPTKGKAAPAKGPAAPKPMGAAPRPSQSPAQTPQVPAKPANQSPAKTGAPPAPKATTPPAPKPRDPSVARRDERREARRLEIQARQRERRHELRQAKRQTLIIRYDLIVAPILLIALVALFLVLNQPIDALISGLIILFAGFTVLAYATVMSPARTSRLARPRTPALEEAEVVEGSIDPEAQPPAAPADQEVERDTSK
ncbi:MAG TPA: hypothetical protein VFU69_10880 [Ktedonobacterales bacterium]|nr:hypothetical protein [Ktedonobacterales bacterium]